MGPVVGGTKHSKRIVTVPDGQLKGLKSMDLGHGHSGQGLGTFLVDTTGKLGGIWCVEPENTFLTTWHGTAAHRRESRGFPSPRS